jgi:hypothetical protein
MTRRLPVVTPALIALLAAIASLAATRTSDAAPALWWLAGALAAGIAVWGLAALRGATLFGALAAALMAGSAAQLWLTEPLWFPALELKPGRLLAPGGLIAVAALAIEGLLTFLVLAGIARGAPAPLQGLRRLGMVRLLMLLALGAAMAVSVTPYLAYGHMASFGLQVVAGGALLALHLGCVAALLSVPAPGWARVPPAWAMALFATVAAALLARYGFQMIPHVEDEVAYLFQARLIAGGALSVPVPPGPAAAYDYYLFAIRGAEWLPVTAPGWPAVLALGVLAGAPWLVNPLLTGGSVLLAHGVFAAAVSRERALLVAGLMATSPWVLGTGASLMTHAVALFALLLAWRLLVRAGGAVPSLTAHLLAGLAMGWLFTTRPLEGVIAGGLTGLWLLAVARRGLPRVAAYGAGCIGTGLVYFAFNWAVTGTPLASPLQEYLSELWPGAGNAFGFGPDIGPPAGSWGALDYRPGHSLLEGLVNTLNCLTALNRELHGWVIGSLLPVAAALLWPRRLVRFDLWLGLLAAVVLGVMVTYWFNDGFYVGPRYWYIAAPAIFALSAAGLLAFRDRLLPEAGARALPVLMVLCAIGLLVFLPWRTVTKYRGYNSFTAAIAEAARGGAFGSDLVLVKDRDTFGVALSVADPFLGPDGPVFALDLGPEANAAVIAAYPDRKVTYWGDDPDE